jgi:hypothetical protein
MRLVKVKTGCCRVEFNRANAFLERPCLTPETVISTITSHITRFNAMPDPFRFMWYTGVAFTQTVKQIFESVVMIHNLALICKNAIGEHVKVEIIGVPSTEPVALSLPVTGEGDFYNFLVHSGGKKFTREDVRLSSYLLAGEADIVIDFAALNFPSLRNINNESAVVDLLTLLVKERFDVNRSRNAEYYALKVDWRYAVFPGLNFGQWYFPDVNPVSPFVWLVVNAKYQFNDYKPKIRVGASEIMNFDESDKNHKKKHFLPFKDIKLNYFIDAINARYDYMNYGMTCKAWMENYLKYPIFGILYKEQNSIDVTVGVSKIDIKNIMPDDDDDLWSSESGDSETGSETKSDSDSDSSVEEKVEEKVEVKEQLIESPKKSVKKVEKIEPKTSNTTSIKDSKVDKKAVALNVSPKKSKSVVVEIAKPEVQDKDKGKKEKREKKEKVEKENNFAAQWS